MIRCARGVLRLLMLIVVLYVAWGLNYSSFYQSIADSRTAYAARSTGDIEIGVMWSDDVSHTYQTGVEVGIAEVNARGIKMADSSVRYLRPVFVAGNNNSPEDFGVSLTSLLSKSPHMVATLVGVPPRMANKASIVCDAYGTALLLSTPHDARQSISGFPNMVSVIPPLPVFARLINTNLESVVSHGDSLQPIRVGIMFDASPADASITIHSFLQSFEEISRLFASADLLHKFVVQGDLGGKFTLGQLLEDPLLQSSGADGIDDIDTLIQAAAASKEEPLDKVLAQLHTPRRPLELAFVQYYTKDLTTATPLVSMVGQYKPDVIILLGNRSSLGLLKERTREQIPVPVVTLEMQQPEFYRKTLGYLTDELVVASTVNPDLADPDFQDFKKRFSSQAQAQQRGTLTLDDQGLAGYESVLLLEKSLLSAGSSTPASIISGIKYPIKPWKIAGHTLVFDKRGIPVNRKTYLLKYTEGRFQALP